MTLKMNWQEAALGPVILVVWRYLRVQAFCLWLVRLSSWFFGYFSYLFCSLREEEERFANYAAFFFFLLNEKSVFLVLIKCSNWIPYFWENNLIRWFT